MQLQEFIEKNKDIDLSSDVTFVSFINEALYALQLTQNEARELLDISGSTIRHWKTGRYVPHPLVRNLIRDTLLGTQ